MLRGNGEDIATQAELLRNSQKVALEHYTGDTRIEAVGVKSGIDADFGEDSANGTFRHMAVRPTVN
jgi:hypothetical protein